MKPRAICRVAIHDSTDQPGAFQHQPLVYTARGVAENDVLAPVPFGKIARAEQVAACDFQLGCHLFRGKCGGRFTQRIGGHFGLIVQRGHQPEHRALMFNTLPKRQDVGVGCDHGVVNMNAAPNGQIRVFGQRHVRADAHGHNQQITRNFGAIVQPQTADAPVGAKDFLGIGRGQNGNPFLL